MSSPEPRGEKPRNGSRLTRPLTRRQILKYVSGLAALPAAGSVYSFGIEPARVVIEHRTVKLPGLAAPFSAAQISDIHFHGVNRTLHKAAALLSKIKPNLLLITGDLAETREELPGCLRWIDSLGFSGLAYFCPGNWEYWSGNWEAGLAKMLENQGIVCLQNRNIMVKSGGAEFLLVGIDDAFYGSALLKQSFAGQPDNCPTVVISHAPCVIHRLEKYHADVILSGHTHGGQVVLPFVGALKTPPGSAEFVSGHYQLQGKSMFVNRGLGTSILPVRFACPPEITLINFTG